LLCAVRAVESKIATFSYTRRRISILIVGARMKKSIEFVFFQKNHIILMKREKRITTRSELVRLFNEAPYKLKLAACRIVRCSIADFPYTETTQSQKDEIQWLLNFN